ncbi:hypothetical protein EMIHUDRAFT_200669 [Emiliania huxleyi CCMP1516]|uniref:Uncharacterized protein n=2 Tax=Emiliania huxleyi TaxID=2903 RepID=A0A0D3KQX8_EMIH1|nr:hypothetical protein EMIHUDRAFT_200669 [Emiliania huxleyi CCMP1516]EOD38163.1 hypothetical protein EMIHUDRAFT_200669 [Emiliania huxleyi CCMP1516]|eukprot:XP_005790592.1 hypothetical protein EMIHUDRAFT_200669 [Emiliania huxleyi CCMP1516]
MESSDLDEAATPVGGEASGPEGQQRWSLALEEALATQRALQAALPAHDDEAAWHECWAKIKAHEVAGLDDEELQQRRERQADLASFRRGRFAPAVRSARTSAAALRQKNNSQLHPLLRNATDNAAAGATSLHGASPPGASPPGS